MKPEIEHILKDHKLRNTDCRYDVLDIFLTQKFALSHADLEHSLANKFDRVTVYRTLKTFLEKGIIHKVLNDEGTPKYAICSSHCEVHQHHHNHVHFKCDTCGHTQCLDDIAIPTISLPNGFKAKEFNLLIQGLCQTCQVAL
ncbi:Fur family transcriptional regulator [bacterium 336/3]|nr:Fur family transcriptional regulator [bacterium 336/3]